MSRNGARPSDPGSRKGSKKKPKGRRNLAQLDIPEQRIELLNPELEGKAKRIGWEMSYKLGRQKPGPVRLAIARAKYEMPSEDSDTQTSEGSTDGHNAKPCRLRTAPLPRSLLRRSLLAPSMLAHIIVAKFRFGLPYYRLEQQLATDGIELDRGSMARSVEDVGASLDAVVQACAEHARKNAFCLSTDATGIAIQPERLPGRERNTPAPPSARCSAGFPATCRPNSN